MCCVLLNFSGNAVYTLSEPDPPPELLSSPAFVAVIVLSVFTISVPT